MYKSKCNENHQIQCDGVCFPDFVLNDNKYDSISKCDEQNGGVNRRLTCSFNTTTMDYPKTNLFLTSDDNCKISSCAYGQYKCMNENYCIAIEYICDGVKQCPRGDDEQFCSNSII